MAIHRNIIDFDPNRRPPRSEPPFALSQLVVSAQRTAKHHMKKLLPEFFSKVDDSLFSLAEKAENNQIQAAYFDAMREARLQKDAIIEIYHQHLETLFNQSLAKNSPFNTATPSSSSLDQIGLMGDEELEESLAFTTMAEHADGLYREVLFGLTARLNFLIEEIEVNKDNNPLRPAVICEAFARAIERLNADIKVRLVIYKLFDKHVAQQLNPMYDTINADLVAAGVLPRIKHTIQKSADVGVPAYSLPVAGTNGAHQSQGNDTSVGYPVDPSQPQGVFESLQQMLSVQRTAGGVGVATGVGTTGSPTGNGGGVPGGASGGAAMGSGAGTATLYFAPQDILGALSVLQANTDLPHYQDHSQPSADFIKASLKQEISRLHGDAVGKHIDQADTDTIDIVSMLFDFILDDPGLSDHIKALIARLQIPLLKVAILDKAFFAKKSHPARQLLNELAYAGSDGMDENNPEGNATYKMVAYVVDRILMEFQDDPSLFATLLEEFTRFVEEEREANRIAEEMLSQSKERVASEIQRRVQDNNKLPPFIRALLVDAWKEVLTHIFLRDGDKGVAWSTALQVADDLIWSVQPKLVVSERQRLVKVIPRVLNGLRDGLTLIAYDRDITQRIFEELEKLHLASLRGGVSELVKPAPLVSRPEPQAELQIEGLDDDFVSDDEFYAMTSHSGTDKAAPAPALGNVSIEDIVMASEQALNWDGWNELESDYFHEVKEMALGTWVEFIKADTYQRVRGKLAWKCDFTGDYTFVDRKYKVVADLTFKELLRDFDAGRAFPVEDVPLFDRALDSVIKGFKRALGGPTVTSSDN